MHVRWLQFRLRTLLLLATAICIYLAWPHLSRQYAFWRLCRYGDRDPADLWNKLESAWSLEPNSAEGEQIERLVKKVIPRQHPNGFVEELLSGRTWMLRNAVNNRARLMIVKVRPPMGIPGSGDVRIVLLDRTGRIIAAKTISTGNRMFVRRVTYDPSTHRFPYLVVESDYFWAGWTQSQYIAVEDNRIAEVQICHKPSKPEEGRWRAEHHQLGAEHRFTSQSAWSRSLMSGDEIEVLEALLYLPPEEAIKQRNAVDIARLQELSRSSDGWIREGAAAALARFDVRRD